MALDIFWASPPNPIQGRPTEIQDDDIYTYIPSASEIVVGKPVFFISHPMGKVLISHFESAKILSHVVQLVF